MKRTTVSTRSGSFYLFKEDEEGRLQVTMGNVIPNRDIAERDDRWRYCVVTPWPPQLARCMHIMRASIPRGQGQETLTSQVAVVVRDEEHSPEEED